MNADETAALLKTVLRRPVAYHRAFAEITGKVSAGLMLSQAWYWTPRTENEDGWFYKTRAEWQEETGMTRTEQETARKRLVSLGLMDETLKGMPGKLHYRVNTSRLVSLLVENLPTGRRKTYQQAGRKAADMLAEKPPTLNTESTTETTIEITREPSAHAALMELHAFNLKGPIADAGAQGAALKWLLTNYAPDVLRECYQSQLVERWRAKVSWLTVRSDIGSWLSRNGNGNNQKHTSNGNNSEGTFEFKPKSKVC